MPATHPSTWSAATRRHLERAAQPHGVEPAAGDDLTELSHRELQAEAKRLGVSAAGSSDALRARIREAL